MRSSYMLLYQINSIDFVSSGSPLLRPSTNFLIYFTNEQVIHFIKSIPFAQLVLCPVEDISFSSNTNDQVMGYLFSEGCTVATVTCPLFFVHFPGIKNVLRHAWIGNIVQTVLQC